MNVLDGAFWRSYFLLKTIRSRFKKNKEHVDKVKYDKINFRVKLKTFQKLKI